MPNQKFLKFLAIAGNILFVLWMTFNGIDEGFKASRMQIFSYLGLFCLVALNSFLILWKKI